MPSKPAITVAICTYRRADLLPVTLASLAALRPPRAAGAEALPWELLLVDNACDPGVARIAEQFQGKLPIRYEQESTVGIAHARNRAVAVTTAPIILFADDDVLFDSQWLSAMAAAMAAHPECAFWGGRIQPRWQVPCPAWFDTRRCPSLGDCIVQYDRGSEARYWDPMPPYQDPPFYTCNLALRTDAVRSAGMFDVTLGHRGMQRGSGEDSWLITRLAAGGGRGWYAADALVHHPVEPRRLTRSFARGFAWRQGRMSVEMLRRQAELEKGARHVPRWLYGVAAGQVLRGCGRWLSGTLTGDSGLGFAGEYAAIFNASKLVHTLPRKWG
jgi:glycosyltransferase involved in cell wall biosynthesis